MEARDVRRRDESVRAQVNLVSRTTQTWFEGQKSLDLAAGDGDALAEESNDVRIGNGPVARTDGVL